MGHNRVFAFTYKIRIFIAIGYVTVPYSSQGEYISPQMVSVLCLLCFLCICLRQIQSLFSTWSNKAPCYEPHNNDIDIG